MIGLAQCALDARCDLYDNLVRFIRADGLIDDKKIVNIDMKYADCLSLPHGAAQHGTQGIEKCAAIGQTGQLVEYQKIVNALLIALTLRNVFANGEVVLDVPPFIANGTDGLAFEILLAILSTVDEFAAPDASGVNGFPKIAVNRVGRLSRFEQARRFPEDLG